MVKRRQNKGDENIREIRPRNGENDGIQCGPKSTGNLYKKQKIDWI